MHVSYPLTKTKAAFLLSCEKLFLQPDGIRARRVYMWTFTFPKVVSDEVAMKSWKHLNTILVRKFKPTKEMPGIRVVEVHPGGHGLHFHVLIAARLPVDEVRRCAIRAGFGRIHVQKCKQSAAEYCAKYLSKADDGLRKGTRRWGMFAGFKGTLVKNIVVESELADNCRAVRKVVKGWSRGLFVAVNRLTVKFGPVCDWPTFPALEERKQFQKGDEWLPEWAQHVIRPVRAWIKHHDSELNEWVSTMVALPVLQPF